MSETVNLIQLKFEDQAQTINYTLLLSITVILEQITHGWRARGVAPLV